MIENSYTIKNKEVYISEIFLIGNFMWCRYCGSTTTSRWRPSPWGKNKLCNAHWKKWHESKLDLNIKEPTSPICRLKNNEFLFRERTKKRKRSSSVTEDELEGKITLLFYIRKKIQEVEQMFHSLQIALKKDFFLSLYLVVISYLTRLLI